MSIIKNSERHSVMLVLSAFGWAVCKYHVIAPEFESRLKDQELHLNVHFNDINRHRKNAFTSYFFIANKRLPILKVLFLNS